MQYLNIFIHISLKRFLLLFCFIIIFIITPKTKIYAQKTKEKPNYKVNSVVRTDDNVLAKTKNTVVEFKNLNKYGLYRDEKILSKIEKDIKARKFDKAYPELYKYVKNFGIENFYKDTYLLWRLAKLIEIVDDPEIAKIFYRLVLKHHRGEDVKNVEVFYDSITVNQRDYFVPLEYYYELVEFRKQIDTLYPPQGVLIDMGPEINSDFADYGPSLNATDDVLLFTSKRNKKGKHIGKTVNEDIFFSKKDKNNGFWDYAKDMKGINTIYNEGSAHMSKDGKTVYFSRCESPDGFGNCDLYVARLQADSTWKTENMGAGVNSTSWDSHPSLSHKEDTLYFASDRLGGFGMSDIYFTHKLPEGGWAKAQNIGPNINTRQSEVSPYFHPIYAILYFSSDGHIVNFGSFDIYKSYNYFGRWQEPKNVGPLVNGVGSEYYFTIDGSSKNLYYAKTTSTDDKDFNIQSFPLPMEAQPNANSVFKGNVVDAETGNPFKGIVAVVDLDNGIEVAPKFLRPDGSYEFDLIKNNNYLVIITGDDFFRIEEKFFMRGDTTITTKANSIKFKKWEFKSMEFDARKADIKPEMEADLDKLVKFLADHPGAKIKIGGHTDADGNEKDNIDLSQNRADAIKDYVIKKGKFKPERIIAIGYGGGAPLVPESTAEDKRLNRRVEFEILK